MCVHDVWFYFSDLEAYKKVLDQLLPDTASVALKRASEPNVFIAEEADKCLHCLCCTGGFNTLITFLNRDVVDKSKNHLRKAKVARCYATLVRRLGRSLHTKVKDFAPMVKTIVQMTGDAHEDTRAYSKATVNEINILYEGDVAKFFAKILTPIEIKKFKDVAKKVEGHFLDDLS